MVHRTDHHAASACPLLRLTFALLTCASGVQQARAHGGFWRADRIHIASDHPDRIVLRSDLRGLVFSEDGGASWRWMCAEAYGRSSTSAGRVR